MKRNELHPLVVRIWHWANAICFLLLIITGAQIRYRGILNIMPFRSAVEFHNDVGFLLIGVSLVWTAYYLISGRVTLYLPDILHLSRYVPVMLNQAVYYGYGIFRGEPNPHHPTPDHKFNPLQQISYFIVMFLLLPLQIMTGVFIWDLDRFARIIDLTGGIKMTSALHLLITFCFLAFLFVHVYLSTLGHPWWQHIKAMFTGYEEEPEGTH